MKFFLLSNDEDALAGMRLAGIEGKFIDNREELISSLEECIKHSSIGIILINSSLAATAEKELIMMKRTSKTLIVEIPDKNSGAVSDSITKYVRDAIGLKI